MKLALPLLAVLAVGPACAGREPAPAGSEVAPQPVVRTRAEDLYARHCALCHGVDGDGNGFAARHLFPPPRDFGTGAFRLVGTDNRVPSDDDLVAVLRRGMPGSSMPAFGWLPDEDLRGLARHVRGLALAGLARRGVTKGLALEDSESARDARREAERRTTPGRALDVGGLAGASPQALERGRELYLESCEACHGPAGKGSELAPHWTEDGSFAWARDFTAGVLKGGASPEAIARRILCGLPGTSMPATQPASRDDLAALVAYVKSLIPAGAEDRLVQHRETLRAARVAGSLPIAPGEPAWSQSEEIELVLAPMEWGSDSVLSAFLAALHDGDSIAIRVRWPDAQRDQMESLEEPRVDGVSLCLSSEAEPPVFGMGSREHPINLWHWRADRMIDRAGMLDLLEHPPHDLRDPLFGESRCDVVPLYLPAPSSDQPTDEVRSLRAEGAQDLPAAASTPLEVRAAAAWSEGEWSVVLTRPLVSGLERAVPLMAGQDAQLALAIWNAAPPGGLARKAVTIWHHLLLDP